MQGEVVLLGSLCPLLLVLGSWSMAPAYIYIYIYILIYICVGRKVGLGSESSSGGACGNLAIRKFENLEMYKRGKLL